MCRGLTGSTVAVGASHAFTAAAAANLREKNDSWNPAIGGFFSGAVLGTACQAPYSAREYIY